jgi:hypothetical protein
MGKLRPGSEIRIISKHHMKNRCVARVVEGEDIDPCSPTSGLAPHRLPEEHLRLRRGIPAAIPKSPPSLSSQGVT